MQDWLIEQGWDELFLDLDPERGIVAGQRWEKALHDAASRCDAVLFLVSQDWLDSDWCRKEFRLAHRLNKRIIGILIEDIAIDSLPDELTSTWQLINLASGNDHQLISAIHPDTGEQQHVHYSKAGLSRLKAGLVKAGLNPCFSNGLQLTILIAHPIAACCHLRPKMQVFSLDAKHQVMNCLQNCAGYDPIHPHDLW